MFLPDSMNRMSHDRFECCRYVLYTYLSLVRSRVEYLSLIWTPHQSADKKRIERLLQKYTRFIYWLTRAPYTSYTKRINHLNMLSLEAKRVYFDTCLLHNILHNVDLTDQVIQLTFRTADRPNRNNYQFRPYGLHTNPVKRLQSAYNDIFNHIDIRNVNINRLKNEVLDTLRNNQSLLYFLYRVHEWIYSCTIWLLYIRYCIVIFWIFLTHFSL